MGKRLEEFVRELKLYTRQWAYLTAGQKRTDSAGKSERLPARIEHFRTNGIDPPLPDVADTALFDWLMEVGPIEPAGMGVGPISWQSIDAWQRRTGAILTPWSARLLRQLSAAYVAESNAAEDWMRAPPWAHDPTEAERAADERRLRAAFGAF